MSLKRKNFPYCQITRDFILNTVEPKTTKTGYVWDGTYRNCKEIQIVRMISEKELFRVNTSRVGFVGTLIYFFLWKDGFKTFFWEVPLVLPLQEK